MIEMKHVNINFGDQVIFNDAHFKTCPGQITGIIGKSGCGKTTFLKSLLCQYKDNLLYVDNVAINNSNKKDYLLNKVSYIDQFGTFFDNMKVYEHFEFINHLQESQYDQTKMNNMLHLVGLDLIDPSCYPSSLSIGQRKRFLIALSMYKDASIIIIDEPTASLDQENKEIVLQLLEKLKSENKYIIITTHDEYLINHLDITYKIENRILVCDQNIHEINQTTQLKKSDINSYHKYFFYKNKRQWFQFILVLLLGFIMTISISTNVSDSLLQENKLSSGIKQANKAELYTGKMNDSYIANGVDSYYIGDAEVNLDISTEELNRIKSIKHVKSVYPFDVFDTINQMEDVSKGTVYYQGSKTQFDYFQEESPMVVPYYSFQNIKVDGKELKGNAISQSFARKLGIDEKEKNFKISIDVYVPVQQYTYQCEIDDSKTLGTLSQVLTKKVNLEIEINHIISTDDYYNEFLSAGYVVLMNDKSFYTILNQYNNQTPDSLLDAKEYNAAITPYQSKNYVVEVDRIKNLKSVENEISQISNNFITYDQYNSVTDMVDVYKEERKGRYIFMAVVILIAIFLYVLVQMNALDDRKDEIKLLKVYGLKNQTICSLMNDNMIVQSILSLLLSIPGFFIARKIGFFVINRQSMTMSLLLFMIIQIGVTLVICFLYICYSQWFVKKVDL